MTSGLVGGVALLGLPLLLVGTVGSGIGLDGVIGAMSLWLEVVDDTYGAMDLMASIRWCVMRPALKKFAWIAVSAVSLWVWQETSVTCWTLVCVYWIGLWNCWFLIS